MGRKVKVKLEVMVSMIVNEGIEIGHIIDEMEYDFFDTTTHATIMDTTIEDFEVIDSK